MESIILPYVNPDLDGVACSISLCAHEKGESWVPKIIGEVNDETKVVLNRLQMDLPDAITDWGQVGKIWLVDTHHPSQLPKNFPNHLVVYVTDHHPGGSPTSYPNAEIQNEEVGAAATLVSEIFKASETEVPKDIALLLQTAIVSNTLGFKAPATSFRDTQAFKWLQTIVRAEDSLFEAMQDARRAKLRLSTESLVMNDVKLFDGRTGKVLISQIEAPGAFELTERVDLYEVLNNQGDKAGAYCAILNIVDTSLGTSWILVTDRSVGDTLASKLHSVHKDGSIQVNRVLQRKTDIVPYII